MPRKPKTEYRIRCSGKNKPWHKDAQNRIHSHIVKDLTKSKKLTGEEQPLTPIQEECWPWVPQQRQISPWKDIEDE